MNNLPKTLKSDKFDDLFSAKKITAPMVAKLLNVDLKTIHNWVNRGYLSATRTPGRHLRFAPFELKEFLSKYKFIEGEREDFLSSGEAASLLGKTPPTIWGMVFRGVIKNHYRTPEGTIRIEKKEIERLKDELCRG